MKSFEIRKRFLNFFKEKRHAILPGASLTPYNDLSLLFVNAGMNQFKEVFLGLKPPPAKNTATIQKCLRAGGKHNDLEEVGATPIHHTFFEMLGNFSFGGYFKEEAIRLAWEFLTEELKIPADHLWAAVHHKDKESYSIWRNQQRLPEHKIYKLGDKDNFWQMGETGPCGYCSEIYYYKGKKKRPEAGELMEIWNLVFMEFEDLPGGKRIKLKTPCVDTGMGLERLCVLLQNKKSNYHTDLFADVIHELEKYSGFQYDFEENQQTEAQKAFRVIADHSRAISLLIAEGVTPGNQKESYVLRRIIRRALYYSQKLKPKANLLSIGAEKAIALMEEAVQDLGKSFKEYERHFDFSPSDKQRAAACIRDEDESFSDSLKEGRKKLEEAMWPGGGGASQPPGALKEQGGKLNKKSSFFIPESVTNFIFQQKRKPDKKDSPSVRPFITAKLAWNLYNTYGFPMDLTRLIAKEKNWDMAGEKEIEEHINRISKNFSIGSVSIQTENQKELIFQDIYHALNEEQKTTEWTAYEQDEEEATIIQTRFFPPQKVLKNDLGSVVPVVGFSSDPIPKDSEGWLLMDKTCFYPEGGGPIGDKGWIETETGSALVLDCQKHKEMIAHKIRVLEGELGAGRKAKIKVDPSFRKQVSISHTSTHLLNSALRSVLGDSIHQAGSLVEPGRLRFDFTFPRPLTKKELVKIEERVYQSIEKEEELNSSHKSFEQAKKEGALYLKGEGYSQEKVRVIRIGNESSLELCGGIHVANTKEIERFKIISEKGVQSGVRRIIAYTGALAKEWENLLIQQNQALRKYLKLPSAQASASSDSLKRAGGFWPGAGFWLGATEKENLFVKWLETKERELKKLRKKIVCLDFSLEQKKPDIKLDVIKIKSRFHPLAEQNLELRERLNLPLPKEKDMQSFWRQKIQSEFFGKDATTGERAGSQQFQSDAPSLNTASPFEGFFEESENRESLKKDEVSLNKESLKKDEAFLNEDKVKKPHGASNESYKKEEPELKEQPKVGSHNPLLQKLKKKERELAKLKAQWEEIKKKSLTKEGLIRQAKNFELKRLKGKLLILSLPLEDRKILSDLSDSLLSVLSSGVLVLAGKSEDRHPVIVSVTKDFQKTLSAGDILKNFVSPVCRGQGGGKASFAQGSISDLSAFTNKLEKVLLEKWSL